MSAPTDQDSCRTLSRWWSRPLPDEVATWPEPPSDIAALIEEYERLFVGPAQVPCPPYESFWREDVPIDLRRSLFGPCLVELQDLYHQLGLQMSGDSPELPDHVAVELEALAFATSGGFEQVAETLVSDHLSRWLPRLCRAVTLETHHPFYRDLAARTASWLQTYSS